MLQNAKKKNNVEAASNIWPVVGTLAQNGHVDCCITSVI